LFSFVPLVLGGFFFFFFLHEFEVVKYSTESKTQKGK